MEQKISDINISYSFEKLNDVEYMMLINEIFKKFFQVTGRVCEPIFNEQQFNQIRFLGKYRRPKAEDIIRKHLYDVRVYSMDRIRCLMYNTNPAVNDYRGAILKGISIDDDTDYSYAHLDDLEYMVFINELFRIYYESNARIYEPIFDERQYNLVRDIIRYAGRGKGNLEEVNREPNLQKIHFFLNDRRVCSFERIEHLMFITSHSYIKYIKKCRFNIPNTDTLDLLAWIKQELPEEQENIEIEIKECEL